MMRTLAATPLLAVLTLALTALTTIGQQTTAKSGAGPLSTAPPATVTMPPGLPELLQDLDACFARGDVDAYMAHFTPDHDGALAVVRQRLERLCAAVPQRQRRSTVVGGARTIGPRVVVLVRSQVELGRAGDGPHAAFAEDWLLALDVAAAAAPPGRARPTFAVEIPTGAKWRDQALLRCPACNYEIGGIAGWLMVLVRSDRAHALEAASFYLLGTDIACDVSVECADEPLPAATLASELGGTLQSLANEPARASAGGRRPVEPWLPPSLRAMPPRGLDAARIVVDLPPEGGGGRASEDLDGSRMLLHVAVFGGLRHLLLVRGSKRSLAQHAATVDDLLASYHLLQVDGAMVHAGSEALSHHCGGQIDGSTYTNVLHDLVLQGPAGWRVQQRTGGAAFRALWTSPAGSTLWLTGHQVPPGMQHWSRATADAWLRHLCTQQRWTVLPDSEVAWSDDADSGMAWRTFDAEMPSDEPAKAGTARPRQHVRILLRKDLLVVANGCGRTPADDEAIQAALATLRRK
jgi:hypothetical protein